MKPIEPQQRDGVPHEVATAMLTEPRARLTNRMRKNCMEAREKVFASTSPIVRVLVTDGKVDLAKREEALYYSETNPRSLEEKTKRRFGYASLRQLSNWLRRSIARRAVVQRKYLAVPNSDVPKLQARLDAIREALAVIAGRLDIIRDTCEDEIAMRKAKCDSIKVVSIGFGSSVKFVRCE